MDIIYERIKELRKERGLTQKMLALKIGYTQPTVNDWEKGNIRPTFEAVRALAVFFDVSSDYLLGLEREDGSKVKIQNSFNNVQGNIGNFGNVQIGNHSHFKK